MEKKSLRRRIVTLALVGGIIATPIVVSKINSKAADAVHLSLDSKIHQVRSGESLGDISKAFYGNAKYYQQLAFYNGIENPNFLLIGQNIIIPNIDTLLNYYNMYYVPVYENPTSTVTPTEAPANDHYAYTYIDGIPAYKIQKNDTLIKICNHFYNTSADIVLQNFCFYNHLESKSLIVTGDVLLIPPYDVLMSYQTETETLTDQDLTKLRVERYGWNYQADSDYTPNMDDGTYMVRTGNKLYGIAKFYYGNGDYDEALAMYNGLSNRNQLIVGQILEIPDIEHLLYATGMQRLDTGNYIPIERYNELHGLNNGYSR